MHRCFSKEVLEVDYCVIKRGRGSSKKYFNKIIRHIWSRSVSNLEFVEYECTTKKKNIKWKLIPISFSAS